MVELTLHPDEVEAIRQRVCRVTVPIASNRGGAFPDPVGSATILRADNRVFLITAAHVLEDETGETLFVSASRTSAPPVQLAPATLVRPKLSDAPDIAVIEVLNEDARAALIDGWECASLDDIGDASSAGLFILSGYPSDRLRVQDTTLMCTCITAITERLPEPPTDTRDPVDPARDLFFLYGPQGCFADGEPADSPHLLGTSGGGVWEFSNARPAGVWTAQKALKLVGIQSSARHFEWFRAHTSRSVREALNELGVPTRGD